MTGTPIATRATAWFRSSAPQLPHSSRKTKVDFVATPHTPPSGKAKTKVDKVKSVTKQQKATITFFPAFSPTLRFVSVVLFFALILQFFHKPFIDILPHSSKLKPTPTRLFPHEFFGSESTSAAISTPKSTPENFIEGLATCGPNNRYQTSPSSDPDSPQQTKETIVKKLQVAAADTNRNMGSNMTLVDKAKVIAEEFEYTPKQVRDGVKEFLRLMGETTWLRSCPKSTN